MWAVTSARCLPWAAWTASVCGHVSPVFALGSMDGEFFEPQYFYAVADDGTISVRGAHVTA